MLIKTVLFDLDGTLADTAPDLVGSMNQLLGEEGLPAQDYLALRPYVSQGVRGLLGASLGLAPGSARYDALFARFLSIYEARICQESRLFDGIAELLDHLERQDIAWGIVTNKRERYTLPLLEQLGLRQRAACIVSGDTTPEPKPSPLPILHALQQVDCTPVNALYIGDDIRDITAGRAAGTHTGAATFGYLGDSGAPETWNAHYLFESPASILALLLEQEQE